MSARYRSNPPPDRKLTDTEPHHHSDLALEIAEHPAAAVAGIGEPFRCAEPAGSRWPEMGCFRTDFGTWVTAGYTSGYMMNILMPWVI